MTTLPHHRVNWSKHPAYLVGTGNYTWLHYPDGTKNLVSITLKHVLPRFSDLVLVAKGRAVNLEYVATYRLKPASGRDAMALVMRDGLEIGVSRRKQTSIKQLIEKQLKS